VQQLKDKLAEVQVESGSCVGDVARRCCHEEQLGGFNQLYVGYIWKIWDDI